MAVMNRMRSMTPVILWILLISFLGLIIFEWGMDYLGLSFRSQNGSIAGTVNDKQISREELNLVYKRILDNYKQRNKDADIDPSLDQMIQDEAWNQLVSRTLIQDAIHNAGLKVTDQELYDWVMSDNPPSMIRQQFTDKNGQINKAALQEAMNSPENKAVWAQFDKMAREEKLSIKYQNLIANLVTVSPVEVMNKYSEDNSKVKVDYILFAPEMVADSLVNLTDSDIEKFYNSKKEEFKQKEMRSFKYVAFPTLPTKEDSSNALADIQKVTDDFKTAADDSLFVLSHYSEKPYTSAWFSRGELSDPKEVVFDLAKGATLQVRDQEGFHILKVQDIREGKETKYRARHILIKPKGATNADTAAAKTELEAIKKSLNGSKNLEEAFISAAQTKSQDGSAYKGGDLGWFKDGAMVKPFENAVKSAKVNTMVGPVKTQFGWHLIYVTGKDNKQVKVTEITRNIRPSGKTLRLAKQNAEDFVFMAGEQGFEKEAETRKIEVKSSTPILKKGSAPGLAFNFTLNDWLFRSSVGTISDAIDGQNVIIVAKVEEITPEGFAPLTDQLKESLKPRALREKKFDYQLERAEKIAAEIGNNLVAASAKDPNLVVRTTDEFAVSGTPSGIGKDPVFVGESFKLNAGETSKPFKGSRGIYIVQSKTKTPADMTAFETQKESIYLQLVSSKKSEFSNGLLEALKANAKIEDKRD